MMKFFRYHNEKGISLEAMQEWKSYNGGHAEEGVGENSTPGVCCCDDPDALYLYMKNIYKIKEDDQGEVVVFEGNYVDSCGDGDIAEPATLIERIDIATFFASFDDGCYQLDF